MSARRSILHTLSLATVFRLVRLALSFGLTCALARYLGTSGFGEIGVAMAVISILLCVGELGFGRYTVRELIHRPDEQAEVLGTTFTARFIVSLMLFISTMLWLVMAQPAGALLVAVYALQLLTNPGTEVFAWLEAHDRVRSTVTAQFIGFIIAPCVSLQASGGRHRCGSLPSLMDSKAGSSSVCAGVCFIKTADAGISEPFDGRVRCS